jgi:DNA-binding beta-propeller fold protein YncE
MRAEQPGTAAAVGWRWLALVAAAALLASGCGDGDSAPASTDGGRGSGSGLFVRVTDSEKRPVADAVVSTEPATRSAITDGLGTVLLSDLAPGIYAVTAQHASLGSARGPVTVAASGVVQVELALQQQAVLPGAPTARILSPAAGGRFQRGEPILFRGMVADDKDAASSLTVEWTSNLDGKLSGAAAGADGIAELTVSTLSAGAHVVTLKVKDAEGLSGSGLVTLVVSGTGAGGTDGGPADAPAPTDGPVAEGGPDLEGGMVGLDGSADVPAPGDVPVDPNLALVLQPLSHDGSAVTVTWTPTPEDAFASYRVYRTKGTGTPFEVINILTDFKARAYRDTTVAFGIEYQYRVDGLTATGRVVPSNVQSITAGNFIALNTQVTAMLVDPTRPYLYALDTVNNSLHFVNLTSKTVEKTIFVGSKPADLDINKAGNELFIANFGSTEIAVVNLDTREKARALLVNTTLGTWDGNPYRLVCTAGDTVLFTSLDQWNDLKLVRASDGSSVANTGSVYAPDLAASPDGTSVYVGESGISRSTVYRFDIVGTTLMQVDVSGDVGGYSSRNVVATRDGNFVFYAGQKFLARNLKSVLGTFSEPILAATADGSVVIGTKNIFDGNTFGTIRPLPIAPAAVALSPDDATLYLYDNGSSRIYVHALR